MSSKDYFINHQNINAYTINAFAEAIVEATKQGLALDFDSARRIGSSFSISIKSQEETQVEAEETSADQAESVEAQSVDDVSEQIEALSTDATPVFSGNERPFTVEDIEAASDSMDLLKQLGDPVGVSARSKREMVAQLKEHIGQIE